MTLRPQKALIQQVSQTILSLFEQLQIKDAISNREVERAQTGKEHKRKEKKKENGEKVAI